MLATGTILYTKDGRISSNARVLNYVNQCYVIVTDQNNIVYLSEKDILHFYYLNEDHSQLHFRLVNKDDRRYYVRIKEIVPVME